MHPPENPAHKVFRDIVENSYRVFTTFNMAEILSRNANTLVSLVLHRVAEAMAKPIIETIEPAFRNALKETLGTIQEQINAKTTDNSQTDTPESIG